MLVSDALASIRASMPHIVVTWKVPDICDKAISIGSVIVHFESVQQRFFRKGCVCSITQQSFHRPIKKEHTSIAPIDPG